ncbi:MAG: AMP-binding protein, partial [Saprospiraceae bacterium]
MKDNLLELLEFFSNKNPNRIAFNFLEDGELITNSISYQDLRNRARKIAIHLRKQNLKGERALLLYPSSLEFIVSFFACLYAGVIAVPAYPPRKNRLSGRIKSIVKSAGPKIVLTAKRTKINQENAKDYLGDIPVFITDDEKVLESIKGRLRLPKIEADTLAFLQYTSGSTGDPKGVMISHGNIMANVQDFKLGFSSTDKDRMVTWLPIFHDLGLIYGILHPFYCMFPAYIFPPSVFIKNPVKWLQVISKYKGTQSAAPNFAYDLCLTIPVAKLSNIDLSSWLHSVNGAEPIRTETVKQFNAFFATYGLRHNTISTGYGMA